LAGVTSLQALQAPFLITDDVLAATVAHSAVATQVRIMSPPALPELVLIGAEVGPERGRPSLPGATRGRRG
jgi:hypothetical protein